MATKTTEDIADLIQTTLDNLDKGKWTDLTGDLQEYIAMPQLLKKDKVQFKTGQGIRVNIATDSNGQARWVGLFEVDNYNVNDVMANGTAPWRHATTNYLFDRREEEINSADAEQIVDLVKTRRATAFIDLAKLLETAFWNKPSTSSDVTTMWGVGNYVVKNATTGFNGGNPTGFTTGCIFDSSAQARWKNWTGQYTSFSVADGLDLLRQGLTKTQFKSPVDASVIRSGEFKRGLYTNYDVINAAETICRNNNESLGSDLAKFDSEVVIRRIPLKYVPQLDGDSQDPVYGIDWTTFVPVFLKGEHMHESKPHVHPNQHTVVVVDCDLTGNIVCYDRRRQLVVNKA